MKKILLLLIGCFSLIAFAEKPLPVETFFKEPNIGELKISPDGKHFAAVVKYKAEKVLAILDAKTKKIKAVLPMAQQNREIGPFGWLNNERVYAEMVARVGPLEQAARTGYLFAGNIDGKRKVQLLPKPPRPGQSGERPKGYRILNLLKDEPRKILITMNDGGYSTVYKLDVYNSSRIPVDKAPAKRTRLLADHTGYVRVAVENDIDEEKYRIHLRENKSDDWQLFKEFDSKEVGLSPETITNDLKSVIFQVRDENKKRGIYSLNLQSKELSLIKEINNDNDIENYIYGYDKEKQLYDLIGYRQMPGKMESFYIDKKHSVTQIYVELEKAFPDQAVNIINTTRSGNKSLVLTYSDRNPGTYYLFDHKKMNLEYLLDVNPLIDPNKMAEMEPIKYKARDGLEVRGYLTRPLDKKKDLPLVMYVHGGPYGVKDTWGYNYSNRDTQFLASRGYAVLQINYRGSGGRGNDYQYDAYRKMGKEMQEDLTDAIKWAVDEGIVDPERVCIYGASYGGYAAMMGVVKDPDLYKCAIAYVGVYDIAIQTEESDTADSEYGRRFLVDAWNAYDENFVRERSPIYHLDKLKAAVMLVHGKDDPRVPIEQYDALAEALDDINYPYESIVKAFEGHGFRNEQNNYELYSKIEKFLEKHIGQ